MKNKGKLWGIAAIALAIVVSMAVLPLTGCSNPADDGDVPPEDMPVADRWSKWVDPSSPTTLNYSVTDDGVCTITVGGTPAPSRWQANASYSYTAKGGTRYKYTFEAWTQSGERDLWIQYYDDYKGGNLYTRVSITGIRETHTARGSFLPKDGKCLLEFQCADQTGTFYVKIISITEDEQPFQKMTITGIGSKYGGWMEPAQIMDTNRKIVATNPGKNVIDGTLTFYLFDNKENYWNDAGEYLIFISIWGEGVGGRYIYTGGKAFNYNDRDKYTYTFTKNGSYTINFNQFMECGWSW